MSIIERVWGRYKYRIKRDESVLCIQRTWRRYVHRQAFRELREEVDAALEIERKIMKALERKRRRKVREKERER